MSFAQVADEGTVWVAAIAIAVFSLVLGWVCTRIVCRLLTRAAKRSTATWDDVVVAAIGRPLGVGVAMLVIASALPWLPLAAPTHRTLVTVVTIASIATALWLALRVVDVGHELVGRRGWAQARPSARSLLSMGRRVVKITVLLIGMIATLSTVGVPVTSLVAGLGIGGIALALAAQKTVENLFGTVSIGVDQPFREGDFVRIGEVLGTIEAIGLRSTRVRTLDRTIVTIPNAHLADAQSESYTARDRIRFACTLGLVYQTTATQLRRILADLEATLRAHPKIWPDAVVVRFKQFGESSLDLEVMAWFQTSDWNEFTAIRQDLLLEIMELIERNGSGFAFPTRTLHVVGPAGGEAHRSTPRDAAGQPEQDFRGPS